MISVRAIDRTFIRLPIRHEVTPQVELYTFLGLDMYVMYIEEMEAALFGTGEASELTGLLDSENFTREN